MLAWNGYVALNDGGLVEGQVVDARGRPVPDATVILLERDFVMHNERQRTAPTGKAASASPATTTTRSSSRRRPPALAVPSVASCDSGFVRRT